MTSRQSKALGIGSFATAVGILILGIHINAAPAKDAQHNMAADRDIILASEEIAYGEPVTVKFTEPAGVEVASVSFANLRDDPATGGRTFLAKLTKGSDGNHTHEDAYEAIVLKGTMAHWTASSPGSEKKRLGPGSYWYQPATQLHREDCLSEECILFVVHLGEIPTSAIGSKTR